VENHWKAAPDDRDSPGGVTTRGVSYREGIQGSPGEGGPRGCLRYAAFPRPSPPNPVEAEGIIPIGSVLVAAAVLAFARLERAWRLTPSVGSLVLVPVRPLASLRVLAPSGLRLAARSVGPDACSVELAPPRLRLVVARRVSRRGVCVVRGRRR
jgi:hypothetical protein